MKTFVLMMISLLFAISSEAQNKSFYDFTVLSSTYKCNFLGADNKQ